ncbi:MAG: hypothetical protein QM753_13235 [Thermomicrobiales bacterium]
MMPDDSPPILDPVDADAPSAPDLAAVEAAGDGQLPAVRELILAAYPDVVPDLVAGTTVAELLASVDDARAAYAAVAERIAASGSAPMPVVPVIPGGGGAPLPVDPDRLPASEKIRRGLRAVPASGGTR